MILAQYKLLDNHIFTLRSKQLQGILTLHESNTIGLLKQSNSVVNNSFLVVVEDVFSIAH